MVGYDEFVGITNYNWRKLQWNHYLSNSVVHTEKKEIMQFLILKHQTQEILKSVFMDNCIHIFYNVYHRVIYINLLTSGKLNEYLVKIDSQSQERFSRIVEQMKQTQNITEQLKASNPIKWTGMMNYVRQRVEEIVLTELIYS